MTYYYFTIAFVMLASWAVAGLASAYSPELIIKKYVTVKNERLLSILKINVSKNEKREKASEDDPYRNRVTVVGIAMKALFLLGLVVTVIILFALEPAPITEEHKTALVMPAVLSSFNQKIAHYIWLSLLCALVSVYVLNSHRVLSKADGTKKTELLLAIVWCTVSAAFIGLSALLLMKCIPLFALLL